jgi:serine/threonine-protein kinase RsbW
VAEVDEALHLVVPATPEHVGRLRRAVRRWLRSVLGDEDEDAVDNLTLAASEALENAAEHAYAGHDEVGTMTLSARRDDTDRAVVITVSDTGRWRAPADSTGYRGRGLALIGELTDTHEVQPGPTGTTVTFRHAG